MTVWDVLIIVFAVLGVVAVVLFILNRWASKRMVEHNTMLDRTKQPASIYVIDKKRDKLQNANLPKIVMEQVPKWNKFMKVYLVKAKIGPQITTLICDKEVFNALPLKKTVKADLAGMYISGFKGMKSKEEMAALRRERKGETGDLPWYKKLIGR